MKITVTGASGLLGSSVARALVADGHEVTTLQRRPSSVAGARDVLGSVTDPSSVAEALIGAEAVVHLAAKVSMMGDPGEFEAVNITGTRTLVDAALAAGVRRLVHISSPSVAHTGDSIIGAVAGPASPSWREVSTRGRRRPVNSSPWVLIRRTSRSSSCAPTSCGAPGIRN